MKTTPTQKLTHLIRAACRALLVAPNLEPKIEVVMKRGGMGCEIEIDTFPCDYGPLIGEKGSMKLAVQSVIAATGNREAVQLIFVNSGGRQRHQSRPAAPNLEPLKDFTDAAVAYWETLGFEVRARVEGSESAGIVLIECEERLSDALRAPFLKICRGIGKAHGFPAMAYIGTPSKAGH